MNPLIQLKRTTPTFLIALLLVCPGLSPRAQAVSPPPDGGYPNENTAEGQDALLSLTTGGNNTAIGFRALFSNTSAAASTQPPGVMRPAARALNSTPPARLEHGQRRFEALGEQHNWPTPTRPTVVRAPRSYNTTGCAEHGQRAICALATTATGRQHNTASGSQGARKQHHGQQQHGQWFEAL